MIHKSYIFLNCLQSHNNPFAGLTYDFFFDQTSRIMPHAELFLRRDTQPEEKHCFKAELLGCYCIEALASTFCESFGEPHLHL